MAEINSQSPKPGNSRKIRSKKSSTRIDMTPMVDLAFLLLTFFMLANTFLKPTVMEIAMPVKSTDSQPINHKKVLSLALYADNKIYYSYGMDSNFKVTNFSKDGVRKILASAKDNIDGLYVLIKPTDKCQYKNVVDIFDEIEILEIPRYSLVDISQQDLHTIETITQ